MWCSGEAPCGFTSNLFAVVETNRFCLPPLSLHLGKSFFSVGKYSKNKIILKVLVKFSFLGVKFSPKEDFGLSGVVFLFFSECETSCQKKHVRSTCTRTCMCSFASLWPLSADSLRSWMGVFSQCCICAPGLTGPSVPLPCYSPRAIHHAGIMPWRPPGGNVFALTPPNKSDNTRRASREVLLHTNVSQAQGVSRS